jgi:predicted house-cleaning noncanonical NTP pyrophosphatase (MazG superfamily)
MRGKLMKRKHPLLNAFFFPLLALVGVSYAADPATTSTSVANLDPRTACNGFLQEARSFITEAGNHVEAIRKAFEKGEVTETEKRDFERPDPSTQQASQSLAKAIQIVNDHNLRRSDPLLAAKVLAVDAEFKAKFENKLDEAINEMIESTSLDFQAIRQCMLADLYTDAFMQTNSKDAHLKELAFTAIDKTLKMDDKMPEPYRLRAELNFESDHEKSMADYRMFDKYSDNIHPEIFLYDHPLIERVKKGVRSYLATEQLTTQPSNVNR